jgi:hypothetical protein
MTPPGVLSKSKPVITTAREYLGRFRLSLYSRGILGTSDMSLPDFLGIGAQKAGTSWLCECLRAHPEVFVAEKKELHFFNYLYKRRSLQWYASQFEQGRARRKGEFTPAYSVLPEEMIERIYKIVPNAKIILLIRNPIERAWSAARMELCQLPGRKIEEVTDREFIAHFRSATSIAKGDYSDIKKRWCQYFPESALFVSFFDFIEQRPDDLLRQVFAFLEIEDIRDKSVFPIDKAVGKGIGHDLPGRFRDELREIYYEKMLEAAKAFSGPAEQWVQAEYGS